MPVPFCNLAWLAEGAEVCGGVSWSSARGAPILQACLYAKEQCYALGAGLP